MRTIRMPTLGMRILEEESAESCRFTLHLLLLCFQSLFADFPGKRI
ncbi:hypothetical protein [Candidatus Magnetaquicoccus inordinatus]|nr:hypothetical protein [Candidatus Magnetaquicoccus inordinatus]